MRLFAFAVSCLLLGLTPVRAQDLLFSSIPQPIRTIVCELPDTSADQTRQVTDKLGRAFPHAEIIDAAATDEIVLQAKLKNPFVLFTLLDSKSRLLTRLAQRLPLKLENGNLRWDDFSGPAKDLRTIFVILNPYGNGVSAVFAAGSIPLLTGGTSGNYSYEIANAMGPLRTGTYDRNLAPSRRQSATITAAEWRADLAFLAKELPAKHKNAYHRIPRSEFERRVGELDAAIPKMTDLQVCGAIAQLVAAIGDGHTLTDFRGQRRFDAIFREFPEGLFLVRTTTDQADALGARVIAIDGTPAAEVRRRLTAFVPEENEFSWQTYVALMQHAALLEAAGVVRSQERAEIMLEKNGKTFTLKLSSRLTGTPQTGWAPLPFKTPAYLDRRGDYWFEYWPDSKTLYINYNVCREMSSLPFQRFAEQVLEQAAKQAPQKVIFDLRHNGGGNSAAWDPFLRAVRENPALRPPGRTYVVVGPGTYSSGMLNALQLKQQIHAIVAGEPSTERPNHYGEVRRFLLPNSQMAVSYATKHFQILPDDPPALLPEVRAPLTAADFFAGRDPVLIAIEKLSATKN